MLKLFTSHLLSFQSYTASAGLKTRYLPQTLALIVFSLMIQSLCTVCYACDLRKDTRDWRCVNGGGKRSAQLLEKPRFPVRTGGISKMDRVNLALCWGNLLLCASENTHNTQERTQRRQQIFLAVRSKYTHTHRLNKSLKE